MKTHFIRTKNTYNMKLWNITICLITLLVCTITLNAQHKEGKIVQGYVINLKGDTIHGQIKIQSPDLSEVKVKFYERFGATKFKKRTYKPNKVLGYAYKVLENNNSAQKVEKWITYVRKDVEEPPVPFGPRKVFMLRKVSGSLNLYIYYVKSNTQAKYRQYYFLENNKTKRFRKVTEQNFEGIAESFIENCNALVDRVGRGDFNYFNLDKIVGFYNNCSIEDMLENSCEDCDNKSVRPESKVNH